MGDRSERTRPESQRRVITSFTAGQLKEIHDWFLSQPPEGTVGDLLRKIPDERQRRRTELGIEALRVMPEGALLRDLAQAVVWQTESGREVRFTFVNRNYWFERNRH